MSALYLEDSDAPASLPPCLPSCSSHPPMPMLAVPCLAANACLLCCHRRPPSHCSVEEARQARLAGADCLLIKWELVQQHCPDRLGQLLEDLRDVTCGDD